MLELLSIFGAALAGFTLIILIALNWFLRKIKEGGEAQTLIWIGDEMNGIKPDLKILKNLDGKDASGWSPDINKRADKVSASLERISYLALTGNIKREHIRNMWGPMFVNSWDMLKEQILLKRRSNGEPEHIDDGAFSRRHFETMATYCRENPKGRAPTELFR